MTIIFEASRPTDHWKEERHGAGYLLYIFILSVTRRANAADAPTSHAMLHARLIMRLQSFAVPSTPSGTRPPTSSSP